MLHSLQQSPIKLAHVLIMQSKLALSLRYHCSHMDLTGCCGDCIYVHNSFAASPMCRLTLPMVMSTIHPYDQIVVI